MVSTKTWSDPGRLSRHSWLASASAGLRLSRGLKKGKKCFMSPYYGVNPDSFSVSPLD